MTAEEILPAPILPNSGFDMRYTPMMWPERRAEYAARNRIIFEMRRGGFTLHEIADQLDISESRVSHILGPTGEYRTAKRTLRNRRF